MPIHAALAAVIKIHRHDILVNEPAERKKSSIPLRGGILFLYLLLILHVKKDADGIFFLAGR